MAKNDIQTERMRGYFIQSTKDILKGEGLRGISVRNIADRAGYSYATLYNYFSDIKELIFICVKDFQDECTVIIERETADSEKGLQKIGDIVQSYIRFFIQYPGIFELFYLEGMSDLGSKHSVNTLIYEFLGNLCRTELDLCVSKKIMDKKAADTLISQLNYTVAGLLLFYLNRRVPESYEAFITSAKQQLSVIVKDK